MAGYERYDEQVAAFWDDVYESPLSKFLFPFRHPIRTARGVMAAHSLPMRDVVLDDSAEGESIRRALRSRGITSRDFWLFGGAVLDVPADPEEFLAGRRQQTMRRMLRKAVAAGLTCRAVSESERRDLLRVAVERERTHPDPSHRSANPNLDRLLDVDLWRVCEVEGEPVLLAVLPVSGEWSLLTYFRTLGEGEIHTLARWLTTHDAVKELSARGVRNLLDPEIPGGLSSGVRHFQRMLGFRLVRLRLSRQSGHPRIPASAQSG